MIRQLLPGRRAPLALLFVAGASAALATGAFAAPPQAPSKGDVIPHFQTTGIDARPPVMCLSLPATFWITWNGISAPW